MLGVLPFLRSGGGARSVCSAAKVDVDCEAALERGASAPLRRIMGIAKRSEIEGQRGAYCFKYSIAP